MLKKKSKSKPHRQSKACLNILPNRSEPAGPSYPAGTIVRILIADSLARKYAQTQINACDVFNFQKFLMGSSKLYHGGLSEFTKYYDECSSRNILQCVYNIEQIKGRITEVVTKRLKTDKPYLMHFNQPFFDIMMRNLSSHQVINRILMKKSKMTEDMMKSTEAEEICGKAPKTAQRFILTKKEVMYEDKNSKNQSRQELKALTSTIDKMCVKFSKKTSPLVFRGNTKKRINGMGDSPIHSDFIQVIESRFSFIKSPAKKSKQKSKRKVLDKKNTLASKQIYGLEQNLGKKETSERFFYSNTRVVSRMATEQGQRIAPDSPATRAYYLRGINYTEKGDKIRMQKDNRYHGSRSSSKKSLSKKSKKSISSNDKRLTAVSSLKKLPH